MLVTGNCNWMQLKRESGRFSLAIFAKTVFRTLVIASFAVWFGGFFFYVAFVVPIGTVELGSAREQGFITRLVAHRLNAMCLMALVVMTVETFASWRRTGIVLRVAKVGSLLAIGVLLAWLVLLHPQLDQLLDAENHDVLDRAAFYQLHRVYLWVSTLQWSCAWIWLFVVLQNWFNDSRSPQSNTFVRPSNG